MANNNHFDLTLDTTAPSGSISRGDQLYINANKNLTISKGDATLMKVWFNGNATGTKSDSEYPANPIAASTTYTTTFSTDGTYYYHLTLIDDVNNESSVFNTAQIIFDATRPTISNAFLEDPDTHSHSVTNNLSGVGYTFNYADNLAGVNLVTITGNDINTISYALDPTKTSQSGTFDFKSGTTDGQKTLYIVVTDRAGNTSLTTEVSILLDTATATPTLALETTSGAALPDYINYDGIKAHLTSTDTDIVGYKVWEGSTEPSTWETTGIVSGQPLNILLSETLVGEGTHTFHAKVKDNAGTVVSASDVSVVYDYTPPTDVSVSSDVAIISNISGHTTATLSLSANPSVAGIASYTLKCGNTQIGTGTTLPATFSLTSANSMAEGANTITLIVRDRAGNEAQNTCTVTLDTTAPVVTIGTLNTWYNAHFNINVSITEANTPADMTVWTNTSSSSTSEPSGVKHLTPTTGAQQVVAADITWDDHQDDSNYVHVKVTDSVGNVGYAHAKFGYDTQAPSPAVVSFSQSAYTSTTASINISTTPGDTSGIAYMRVTGDITDGTPNNQWEAFTTPRTVTLTTGDGMKGVQVQLKDNAGNVSTLSNEATCELDTTTPTITLELYNAENTAQKPSVSPLATFTARVTVTDQNVATDPDKRTYFRIWGDFTAGGSSEPSTWTEFTPDSGQTYQSITGLSCTTGDGTKQIKVRGKDSAGNETAIVIAAFTYDTSAPEVTVDDVDYNIVSKVHLERRSGVSIISGDYADECNFVMTPSEDIQAWKVCAYADETAAAAGSHADSPIPNAAGSINMTGNGGLGSVGINCLIKGTDFETALGGTGNDGAHIVVVYVQDMGGTWSAAAEFSA